MLSTKQKGNLTELQCISEFVKLGYTVSIPYGDDAKYDFIVDINNNLYRIQVKTASMKNEDKIQISCISTHKNFKGTSVGRYTKKDIDFFATYWDGMCYLIHVEECGKVKSLRFNCTTNNQTKGITYAENYEMQKQIMLL